MKTGERLTNLRQVISGNPGMPMQSFGKRAATATNLNGYLSNVQFVRIAHDIFLWREAIREMELAYNPMRVRVQRMYMDTVVNGYVKAVLDRRFSLTALRDYSVYQIKGNKKIQSDDLTQALSEQYWFADYMYHILCAKLYGYSLVSLGDIVNDAFPNVSSVRRENIRPDGVGGDGKPVLTSLIYATNGIEVTESPLIDLCNHWVPTRSDRGVSACGYGELYEIALYEIHLRHLLEWNVDYVEGFGMPVKVGSTRKTGVDREEFEDFLASGAANQWILLDPGTEDKVTYEFQASAGTAWKSYDNLENRLEDKISQLILGHTDAMKSTPGKLGGMQAANKDGFNESLVEQAMGDKQTLDGDFCCRYINTYSADKFRKLGKLVGSKIIKGLIPEGYRFGLLNDKEENEIRRRKNAQNKTDSEILLNLYKAGYKRDAAEAGAWMGMSLKEAQNLKTGRSINEKDDAKELTETQAKI